MRAQLAPARDIWRAPIRMLASVLWVLAVVLVQLPHTHARQAQTPESAASLRAVSGGWWMPAARQGSVRGGSLLTLAATRFDLSTPYVAKFTGVNDEAAFDFAVEVQAAPTLPTSLTKLVIVVPSWPAHETNVTVSLLEAGLTSLAPARGNTTSFEYLSDMTSIEGATVPLWRPPSDYAHSSYISKTAGTCSPIGPVRCSVPVSGVALLTVSGAGFQQRICPEDEFCIDVQYTLQISNRTESTQRGEKMKLNLHVFEIIC